MSHSTVEKLLGRPLAEEDRGTVPSLGDFSPALFDEARRLARESHLQAVYFLRYYVVGARLDDMADFIDEVLIGGADPQAWATNDYFCMPVTSWQEILCCEAPALLNPIASLGEPIWGCVAPRRQDWRFASTGAPGIQVRRRYDWAPPI